MPTSFKNWLRRANPELFTVLTESTEIEGISWNDVDHWMWPLLSPFWTKIRSQVETLIHNRNMSIGDVRIRLLGPLLYAFSSLIVDRSPEWSSNTAICGAIYPPNHDASLLTRSQDKINIWLANDNVKPIFISLGSASIASGADIDYRFVLKSLIDSSLSVGLRVIASGDPSYFNNLSDNHNLYVVDESIDHTWILKKCQVAVHHGGSGTIAAALRAGLSQVICPLMFDQFFWAERMTYLGYGFTIERKLWQGYCIEDNVPEDLKLSVGKKILSACEPPIRLRCASLGLKIRAEDGLGTIISMILEVSNESANNTRLFTDFRGMSMQIPTELKMFELPNAMHIAHLPGTESELLHIYNEIFEHRFYASQNLHSGGLIVDCGAHVGLFSIFHLLESDLFADLRTVAFEPSSKLQIALEYNLARFFPKHKYIISGHAIGECSNDNGHLWYCTQAPGSSTLAPHFEAQKIALQNSIDRHFQPLEWKSNPCTIRTLSEALCDVGISKIEPICLLKIDVEGSEFEILRGVNDSDWPRIKEIIIEVHHEEMLMQIKAFLSLKRYTISISELVNGLESYILYAVQDG